MVSAVCGLVAKFPKTRHLPLPPPALPTPRTPPSWVGGGVGERALQLLGMPIPGLDVLRKNIEASGREDPALPSAGKGVPEPPSPRWGLGGCGSGPCVGRDEPVPTGGSGKLLEPWDLSKQENEGCVPAQKAGGAGVGGPG